MPNLPVDVAVAVVPAAAVADAVVVTVGLRVKTVPRNWSFGLGGC